MPCVFFFHIYLRKQTVASYAACNAEVGATLGSTVAFYSTHNAALDYKAVVDTVNPSRVAIYALSYGTYALNS